MFYTTNLFLRTHDLAILVDSLPNEVEMPEKFKKTCAELTVFAVETRYPTELGIEEYRMDATINDTARVYEWLTDYVERILDQNEEEFTPISK
ncbi:MAG: HEPN domain-containing protein [Selenomonadaceae bacterium]|nr:HEPN domain-containing protein [Selenomonadaceae bacterium]